MRDELIAEQFLVVASARIGSVVGTAQDDAQRLRAADRRAAEKAAAGGEPIGNQRCRERRCAAVEQGGQRRADRRDGIAIKVEK